MKRMRSTVLVLLVLLVLVGGFGVRPAPADEPRPLAVRVNEAIDRGVEWLRGRQDEDGSFHGRYARHLGLGTTGLAVHALVKAGVSAEEPDLVRAAEYLTSRSAKFTYDSAFVILGLDAMQDPKWYPHLVATAEALRDRADERTGLWGYPTPPHDLSNTHLALLALWTAGKRGVETPVGHHKALLRSLRKFRADDGGYRYREVPPEAWATGSMTTAALTILHLAERAFAPKHRSLGQRAAKAAAGAWTWMDRRFSAAANPIGGHFFTELHTPYYLYGLERAAAFAGRRKVGGRDWYREGARQLLRLQEDDGSWSTTADTCFALLFLRRATFTSLGRVVEPDAALGPDDEPVATSGPKPPRSDHPPIGSWLRLESYASPGDASAPRVPVDEATLEPVEGRKVAGRRWVRSPELREAMVVPEGREFHHRIGYLGTWLHVAEPTDAVLWVHQAGGVVVRLDGNAVFERRADGETLRRSPVPVRLAPGKHVLLVRAESWESRVRVGIQVASSDGGDAASVRWSASPDGPDARADLAIRPWVVGWEELLPLRSGDDEGSLDFGSREDVEGVRLLAAQRAVARHRRDALPELPPDRALAQGLLEVRLRGRSSYVTVVRWVRRPEGAARVVGRACVIGPKGRELRRDLRVSIGIYDGREVRILAKGALPEAVAVKVDPWTRLWAALPAASAETLLLFLVVEADPGTLTAADAVLVDELSLYESR